MKRDVRILNEERERKTVASILRDIAGNEENIKPIQFFNLSRTKSIFSLHILLSDLV